MFEEVNYDKTQFNLNKLMKKTRYIIIENIILFINNSIKIMYGNNIGNNICVKQFLPIDKKNLCHSSVDFDKKFLNKKIKDILSVKISTKYSNYPEDKNKSLVEYLINNSEIGGELFKQLFELTFLDCLKHINGEKNIDILNGLMKIDEILKYEDFKIGKDEIAIYEIYIKNYEQLVMSRKSRASKKSTNE